MRTSSVPSRAKLIVSSRNWPSLELNENSVSAAIATYIQFKVDWLAKQNEYSSNTRDAVLRYLSLNANGTFLWVALVCQELSNTWEWEVKEKLTAFPPGLDAFYRRMMDQVKNAQLCKQILGVVSTVYRPVALDELSSFVEMPDGVSGKYEALSKIIALCGSCLALRQHTITFVHQSAKDFLIQKAYDKIYPSKIEHVHHTIYSRFLQVISKKLRRDISSLSVPGFPINQVKQPDPDPLSSAKYLYMYWIGHLLDYDPTSNATNDLQNNESVNKFLQGSYPSPITL